VLLRAPLHWLWEGFAVAQESLGGTPEGDARAQRFAARRARGEVTPLAELFGLDQGSFTGRHYDQTANLVAFLLGDGVPGGRSAVLRTLGDALRGAAKAGAFGRRLGLPADELDRRWRATLGR
jgi:hypothetical protein